MVTRRSFLKAGTAAGVAATVSPAGLAAASSPLASSPVIVSSGNGLPAVTKAMEMVQAGGDILDAVIAGVNIVEADPDDITVGYGGVPNERGEVELDSCVMYGPTCRSGAVASIQGIKHPSNVARLVMERTDHCLLVAKGAQEFAVMHGFKV
ncbi:MAG: isoaspartyl peptidase/L-asparaginase, partial [Bacteroidota bacterium]